MWQLKNKAGPFDFRIPTLVKIDYQELKQIHWRRLWKKQLKNVLYIYLEKILRMSCFSIKSTDVKNLLSESGFLKYLNLEIRALLLQRDVVQNVQSVELHALSHFTASQCFFFLKFSGYPGDWLSFLTLMKVLSNRRYSFKLKY